MRLPPFPVDDQTLDLLWAALHPDPNVSERTSVSDLCTFYSEMAGSDTSAVESVTESGIVELRDPQYHPNDIIESLVAEVRRLRSCWGA